MGSKYIRKKTTGQRNIATEESFRRSNFCKDHRDKIEVPDPLVVEDLISDNLNDRRKSARLIKQYRDNGNKCKCGR